MLSDDVGNGSVMSMVSCSMKMEGEKCIGGKERWDGGPQTTRYLRAESEGN
jgi:hypothetical protein